MAWLSVIPGANYRIPGEASAFRSLAGRVACLCIGGAVFELALLSLLRCSRCYRGYHWLLMASAAILWCCLREGLPHIANDVYRDIGQLRDMKTWEMSVMLVTNHAEPITSSL